MYCSSFGLCFRFGPSSSSCFTIKFQIFFRFSHTILLLSLLSVKIYSLLGEAFSFARQKNPGHVGWKRSSVSDLTAWSVTARRSNSNEVHDIHYIRGDSVALLLLFFLAHFLFKFPDLARRQLSKHCVCCFCYFCVFRVLVASTNTRMQRFPIGSSKPSI